MMVPLLASSSLSAACSSAAHPPPCGISSTSYREFTSPNKKKCSANPKQHRLLACRPPSALPESQTAAASVLVAGIVGVAATLLLRSASSQEQQQGGGGGEAPPEEDGEECWDCGGTGLCGRCKGEGFVFKQLSEDTATKARKAAKNMATRYTAGLPTKWTYCNKCSSTRSCSTCRGSGRITTLTSTSP